MGRQKGTVLFALTIGILEIMTSSGDLKYFKCSLLYRAVQPSAAHNSMTLQDRHNGTMRYIQLISMISMLRDSICM